MEDDDYDLYEDLEAPTSLPIKQRQQHEQPVAPAPQQPAAAAVAAPPSNKEPVSNGPAPAAAPASAAAEAGVAAAEDEAEDEDGVFIVGGDADLPIVVNPPAVDTRLSAGWASQEKGRRAAHYMRRERPLFLGVPPPVPQIADPKPSQLLVIGNLPWWVSDVSLRELSSAFGRVIGVRIFGDAAGAKPAGVALLLFEAEQHAAAAAAGLDNAVASYGGLSGSNRRLRIRTSSAQIWSSLEATKPHWARGALLPKDLRAAIFAFAGVAYANPPRLPVAPADQQHHLQEPQLVLQEPQQQPANLHAALPADHQQKQLQEQMEQRQQSQPGEDPQHKTGISALFPWFDPSVLQVDKSSAPGASSSSETEKSSSSNCSSSAQQQGPPSKKSRRRPKAKRPRGEAAVPQPDWWQQQQQQRWIHHQQVLQQQQQQEQQQRVVMPRGVNAMPLGPRQPFDPTQQNHLF